MPVKLIQLIAECLVSERIPRELRAWYKAVGKPAARSASCKLMTAVKHGSDEVPVSSSAHAALVALMQDPLAVAEGFGLTEEKPGVPTDAGREGRSPSVAQREL